MLRKILILTFGIVLPFLMIAAVFMGYSFVFDSNVTLKDGETLEVFVYPEDDPRDIYNFLVAEKALDHEGSFIMVAKQKKWSTAKPGRYIVESGMSNNDLINMFRAGLQTPVQLTMSVLSSVSDMAGKAGKQLMPDSAEIFDAFTNAAFLKDNDLDYATVRSIVIPNTYEFYWSVSAEDFRDRMLKEHDNFWTEARKNKAKSIGLTPLEVSTLASIVQKETAKGDEMPVVAGLYLNRLNRGILLQSDPTVIYAKQLKEGSDIKISRVLYADLKIDSPYNTYKYAGVPPAPITIPSTQAISAVLNAKEHDYIFMCADPDRPGYHSFATNLREHNVNKNKYVRWLEANNIKR